MSVHGSHDATLVVLSIIIATVASYTALDLAGRVQAAAGIARYVWLGTAAVAMGGGIWSMHFVAMLAFVMPMEVSYDLGLTLLSLLLPILVTGIGFTIVSHYGTNRLSVAPSGVLMGLGIVAMHYTGMAAMRMTADLDYDQLWVAVSVLIAIGASIAALWLAFGNPGLQQKIAAAFAMGVAISGMHYSAMQAAVFTAGSTVHHAHGMAALGQTNLAAAITGTTFLILSLALVASQFDRRFALLSAREAAALRESEERFRVLYSKTPLPLVSLDAEGIIDNASETWLELLGYRREHVIGVSLASFMDAYAARRHTEADWPQFLTAGEIKDAEYRFVTKSGEDKDVLLSMKLERDQDGAPLRALGGLLDVTARKRAEEALLHAQRVDAIGKLTGGVAHDFNNLLTIVLGSLQLLRKRLGDDRGGLNLIDTAIQGVHRGTALTQRMLAFARRQDLKPDEVDVGQLVTAMVELLKRSIGPAVHIETRIPPGLPAALVDANQLELAVMNLALNARDAMPHGGTMVISADTKRKEQANAGGVTPGLYIRLGVSDTGVGMGPTTLARATEPFFTTKGVGKGTGLGLSMVHGLAAQSGGRLQLRSRVGEGTTALIWLPALEREAGVVRRLVPAAAREVPKVRVPSLTVLAIDDDPLVLMGMVAMLEDLGHSAVEAASGESALGILRSGREVDLVITDQAMPGMTGAQLAATLRREWPHLPVMISTGYAELDDSVRDLPRLHKPFLQETLASAIASSLHRAPALSHA